MAQTEPQREQLAADALERNGFTVYLPKLKLRTKRGFSLVPLFASYLFVGVNERWGSILWVPGVVRLLLAGDQPARLPEGVLREIRSREGRDGTVRLPAASRLAGTRVRILSGQFRGHLGIYQGMNSRQRERVLLELLGRAVPVELAPQDVIELDVARDVTITYKATP